MSICFCIYLLHLTSISNFDSRWWNDILEILSFQTKYDQWIQWKIHHSALIFELIKSPAKIDTLPRYSWPAGPGPPWPKAITRNIFIQKRNIIFRGHLFRLGLGGAEGSVFLIKVAHALDCVTAHVAASRSIINMSRLSSDCLLCSGPGSPPRCRRTPASPGPPPWGCPWGWWWGACTEHSEITILVNIKCGVERLSAELECHQDHVLHKKCGEPAVCSSPPPTLRISLK